MDGQINWHDLEIFHAVLDAGSFSAAARQLDLSQPTVSRHIEALEQKLGRELFTRARSGLEPSELALTLGQHAARMSEGMYAIQRTLDGEEEKPGGLVTLTLAHGFGSIPVALCLDDFHVEYPDISIDLKFGAVRNDLGRRESDIDVRWEKPSEAELISRSMGPLHFGLYASPRYLQRYGVPEGPEDLDEHMFPYGDPELMGLVIDSMVEYGFNPRRFPFRTSRNMMMTHVLGSMGITLSMAPVGLAPQNMTRVVPDYRWATQGMWLTMHSALRRNTRIRVVWERLVERLPAIIASTRGETETR